MSLDPEPSIFDLGPTNPIRARICNHGVRQYVCTQWICRKEIAQLRDKLIQEAAFQPMTTSAQTTVQPTQPPTPSGPVLP